ncbi:MAG: hypothetical protein LWX55_11395 [Deltaproteobacteria bacterium]|nr:hypothetical protein [Deltaproteobacteria bacterium]
MKIEYRSPTVSEYKKLRGLVGWWETLENATDMALKNSLFSVVAVEHGTVIGFGLWRLNWPNFSAPKLALKICSQIPILCGFQPISKVPKNG